MSMAGCFLFVDTVNKNDVKDGDVKWTDDYMINFLPGHKCRGGVKYDDECWKIKLILSSGPEDELVWPVAIDCKVSVLRGAKSLQIDTFSHRWCNEDVDINSCSWDDCVTIQHSDLMKEGLSDTENGKVTFMWFLEPSANSLSSANGIIGENETGTSENKDGNNLVITSSQMEERRQHSSTDEGSAIQENPEWPQDRRHSATLTYTVDKNKLKAGDILWTQSYKCDYPVLHRIQGGIKMETDRWLFTLIPSSDQQNQHLKWPVRLEVKLYTSQGNLTFPRGSLDTTWQKDELSNAYNDFAWENSIKVSLADLQEMCFTDATDGLVTIRWDVDVMLPPYESRLQQAKESTDQLDEIAWKFKGMMQSEMDKFKDEMGCLTGMMQSEMGMMRVAIEKMQSKMESIQKERESIQKERGMMQSQMESIQKERDKFKDEIDDFRREMGMMQSQMESIQKGRGKMQSKMGRDKFFYSSDSDSETESISRSRYFGKPGATSIPVRPTHTLESTSGSTGLSGVKRKERRDQPRK